jgi:hypothetical protein
MFLFGDERMFNIYLPAASVTGLVIFFTAAAVAAGLT